MLLFQRHRPAVSACDRREFGSRAGECVEPGHEIRVRGWFRFGEGKANGVLDEVCWLDAALVMAANLFWFLPWFVAV